MKLSEKMREHETGEMDRWADEAAKLEAELEMYERDETFGTLAIRLAQLEEDLAKTTRAIQVVIAAGAMGITLERQRREFVPRSQLEDNVLRNTISLLKNENERLTDRVEELEEDIKKIEINTDAYADENATLKRFVRKVHGGPHHTAIDATKCKKLVDWVCDTMDEAAALLADTQESER